MILKIKNMNLNYTLRGLTMMGILFQTAMSQAQMHNKGSLFIGEGASVYLSSGAFSALGDASTKTFKTGNTPGMLSLGSVASIVGTSGSFVDGWVKTLGTSGIIMPIGQMVLTTKLYADVRVTPAVLSTGVRVAYFRSSTDDLGAGLDVNVAAVRTSEYWKFEGSNAKISLTWNSQRPVLSRDFADLTIVGYNPSSTKWEVISSLKDNTSVLGGTTTATSGSITSSGDVTISNYSAFALGTKSLVCPELNFSPGLAVSFTGLPFSVAPTLNDVVTVNVAGAPGSFVCNSLVLNADITLADGQFIEVVNGITGTGRIIMSSTASLVQRNNVLSPAPNIVLTKKTRELKSWDYVYWGSPVAGDVFSQLTAAKVSGAALADAFEMKHYYQAGAGGGWRALTATETGKGFIARIKAQAPFLANAKAVIDFTFTGVANNGDISVNVIQNPAFPNGGTSHNLVANPYPSAIDADAFLQANTAIDGVIYIWKQTTPSVGSVTAYGQADYMAYTRAGFTDPSNVSSVPFTGKIASGQGFMVKALTNSTVTFTNCMRVTGENTNFMKTVSKVAEIDRYKVNMIGQNGVFSQIVVAYLPQGTLDYDRMYDAGRNSVSSAQLFSILDTDGSKLAINARPNFSAADVVKLGVSKKGVEAENFTLSMGDKEGIFQTNVSVYLHDILLNTYTDLTRTDYTFSANTALLSNRFELVYANKTLDIIKFENDNSLAYINNGVLAVTCLSEIKDILVYDILGKQILALNTIGEKTSTALFPFAEGIYIAKILLENGNVATKKLVNKK